MLDATGSSNQWIPYAKIAKYVGERLYSLDQIYEGDAMVILTWLYYHLALFRFTARHWIPNQFALKKCGGEDQIIKAVLQSGNTSKVFYANALAPRHSLTNHRLQTH
jgi:hypothetical protein